MSAEAPKRVGRPRSRSQEEAPGEYVGFRAPRELKQRLEQAAKASNRSLSTEAQMRLERSFERQGLLEELLELEFGPGLAGMLIMAGEVMRAAGKSCLYQKQAASPEAWLADPDAYRAARIAGNLVLEEFDPAELDATASHGQLSTAERFAAARIFEVTNEGGPYPAGQRDRIDLIRRLIGPDLMRQSRRRREDAAHDAAIMAARRELDQKGEKSE